MEDDVACLSIIGMDRMAGYSVRVTSPYPTLQGDVHRRADSEGDEDACVVCLAAPATTALVHGSTGHRCCCQPCAVQLKNAKQTCPMCRQPFDQILQVF